MRRTPRAERCSSQSRGLAFALYGVSARAGSVLGSAGFASGASLTDFLEPVVGLSAILLTLLRDVDPVLEDADVLVADLLALLDVGRRLAEGRDVDAFERHEIGRASR